MNKEELLKEIDRRLKVLRKEFIRELNEDKKEFKLTYPEDRKTVYYIDSADEKIGTTVYYTNDIDCKFLFEHGYFFETKKEAEQHLKEQRLLFKIKKWAEIHNEGWQADWRDYSEEKYTIYYSGGTDKLRISIWNVSNFMLILPSFKTKEIAQACIDEFGEEIKEVFY
jgi:hypothetical protein|nr:MAG TPA: hypothetical protein [Caudoviricetes sp.]